MREFVPFICFVLVAFSGVFFGVTNRRGALPAAPAAGSGAPATATRQDKAEAATAALPAPVRLLREFFEIPAPLNARSPDALRDLHRDLASRGWEGLVQ